MGPQSLVSHASLKELPRHEHKLPTMLLKNHLVVIFILFTYRVRAYVYDLASTSGFPVVKGTRCQSRMLPPGNGGSSLTTSSMGESTTNVTGDDRISDELFETFPYCPNGFFCDLTDQTDADGNGYVLGLCKPCSGSSDSCESSSTENDLERAIAEECQEQCGIEKNTCSRSKACQESLFCNFEADGENGYCAGCPRHVFFCNDFTTTDAGFKSCQKSCDMQCLSQSHLSLTYLGPGGDTSFIDDVNTMAGSPQLQATGPVVDCGLGLEPCEGAEGAVCLMERGKAPFFNKTANCYAGGGVAAVIYNVETICTNIEGTLSGQEAFIPVISLNHLDGKAILKKAMEMPLESPLLATVDISKGVNEQCWLSCTKEIECSRSELTCDFANVEFGKCIEAEFREVCNDAGTLALGYSPCTAEGEFCDFSGGKRGFCTPCPEVDAACFFSDLNGLGAKECAKVCTAGNQQDLKSAPCKFCPKGSFDIGDIEEGFLSTQSQAVTEQCQFCASTTASTCSGVDRWDMKYPFRTIRMFGTDVECWAVAELYSSLPIEANSVSCNSARFYNYICGCSDSSGYVGADNDKKQAALVWMPRVGSILSALGSAYLIVGVLRDERKRKKAIGEIIVFLSVFDIIGSIGYAFTSLPTPKEDYIYGAQGSKASCTAQGFFIQIGTVALYANVSIAFYYLMIIKYSWREERLKKSWVYPALFAVPLFIGFVFAFAGIPYYDNVVLWCNNSQNYWSEIPVILGIAVATIVMINLCWFVYKSERASRRFRRHNAGERQSLSHAFFLQALVYLCSFYLTWPPYLALQLMIARGQAFSHYGFYLYASTAVTLQGFWNFTFHTGLHARSIAQKISKVWTSVRVPGSRTFFTSRSVFGGSEARAQSSTNASGPISRPFSKDHASAPTSKNVSAVSAASAPVSKNDSTASPPIPEDVSAESAPMSKDVPTS